MYQVKLRQSCFPVQQDMQVRDITVGELLREAAQRAPRRAALKEVRLDGTIGRIWTYEQLLADAERLARALLSRHQPGDRIAIWAPNIPEWLLTEFAAGLAGMTLVTVNPSFQQREVLYVLRQSRARALYHVENFRGNRMGEIARAVGAEIDGFSCIDLQDHAALFAGESAPVTFPPVSATDVVQIQYTSGTTGFPKGALLHHRGLINNARLHAPRFDLRDGDTVLAFMPLFHTGGCAVSVLGAVSQAATLVLCPVFDAPLMNRLIEQERATHFLAVPTMLVGMIEAIRHEPRDVSSVRGVMSGGAMVAPELVRQTREVFGVLPQIIYGQTETSPGLTMAHRDDSVEDASGSVGQPLPQTEVAILDSKTGAVMPLNQIGEICSRGYMNMHGYNDNPEATAAAIDRDGWLHTGDLGSMDERGYVRVTGRLKEMIIRGGENIFPVEIENAMLEHPDLAEVAVVGIPDQKWGEIVVCFMRARGAVKPARAELVGFCRERLSPQKSPAHWIYVSEWPLTGSGKIQKFQLRDQYAKGLHQPLA